MQRKLEDILSYATNTGSVEVHLVVGKDICFRNKEKKLICLGENKLTKREINEFIGEMFDSNQIADLAVNRQLSTTLTMFNMGRFRINVSYQRGSKSINIKMPKSVDTITSYTYHPTINLLHKFGSGLIVVTGQAGSGKKGTVARVIENINGEMCKTIVTIEDPIEYLYTHKESIIRQKEIGLDVESRVLGVKSSMIEDTEVLYIDDISDPQIMKLAYECAEKGMLVIGCMYTPDVESALKMMIESQNEDIKSMRKQQVSNNLKAIVSHKMVEKDEKKLPAYEILLVSNSIRRLINEDKLNQIGEVISKSENLGMTTMSQSIEKIFLNDEKTEFQVMDKTDGVRPWEKRIV